MGANPHANGGLLLRDLNMPDFRNYEVKVPSPGSVQAADTHELGGFLRDVIKLNRKQRNFRIFGPDETLSNRLNAIFEVTNRQWEASTKDNDEFLASEGRVMEMLSEHQCEGWLEGYLLTGRHGLSDQDFDALFTQDKPIIFAFHGYSSLVHRLTYRRTNHVNMHVHGYKEEGTITTYFDMTVLNDLDRFHLVQDVINHLPQLGSNGIKLKQMMEDKLIGHKKYINKYGQDMPEIRNWKWNNPQ